MRWYLSIKNGLPPLETPDDGAGPWRDDIELTPKKETSQFVIQDGLLPTQLEDDDDFGVHRGSRAYYAATMHFDLPSLNFTQDAGSALDSLFLFATGDNTSGVIRIITKEQNETTIDTRIQVDVVSRFWNADVLRKDTSVCAMRRGRQLGIALLVRTACFEMAGARSSQGILSGKEGNRESPTNLVAGHNDHYSCPTR